MKQDIIRAIKRIHWDFYWTGNWPMLDAMLESDQAWEKEHIQISGRTRRLRVDFSEKRVMTSYLSRKESEQLEKYFLRKFEKDPNFLVRSTKPYRARVSKDLATLKEMHSIKNLRALSNPQLAHLFAGARKHFVYNSAIDNYDAAMERTFIPVLEAVVSTKLKLLGKQDQLVDYISTLLTPHKISVIFQERQKFFDIIRYIRKHPSLEKRIRNLHVIPSASWRTEFSAKNLDPGSEQGMTIRPRTVGDKHLNKLIEKYLKAYNWTPVLVNNPPKDLDSVWSEITSFIKENRPLKVQSKRLGDDYNPKVIKKSKTYERELRLPVKMRKLIQGLRAIAFMRTEDHWVMSKSSYYVIPLYTEIAWRLGLTYYDLKEFLPEEILYFLKEGLKTPRQELAARLKLSTHIQFKGKRYFFTGKQAQEIKRTVTGAGFLSARKEFYGRPAHPGKVIGKVKLALDFNVLSTIQKGDIVVGAFMSSMFGPALSKASGLVTEFGGLTSHPVIVAREFNIPCIVGVKDITKYLKNGDMVEIDGGKGIIKKIS